MRQRKGGCRRFGEHAHRRGINDHLGIGMPIQIAVMVFTRSRDHYHFGGFQIFQCALYRCGCAAVAEHQHFLAAHRNIRALQHIRKAHIIGVIPPHRVFVKTNGVDTADTTCHVIQLGAIRYDRFFIGDRHVDRRVRRIGKKLRKRLFRLFDQIIRILTERRMDLRGQTVRQRSP